MGSIRLSKSEAASEQLDCAIKLHFENSSPASVSTLVGAASVLFTDLVEHENLGASWDVKVQQANGLQPNEYFKISRNLPNSLKHADKDPESNIEIHFIEVDHQLILATLNAGALGTLSTMQKAFQVWYFSVYAESFMPNSVVVERSVELIGIMHSLQRQQQLVKGIEFVRLQVTSLD